MSTTTLRKTYIVLIILIASFFRANATVGVYPRDIVSDMALMYQGGTHRPEWTEDELRPYVVHTFADGRTDWFFDSFLFFEFTNAGQVGFGYKYGKRNAVRSDWEWLLDRVFEKGKSLDALNSCIEHYKTIIGTPSFKHKIVLGVVSPITDQTDWGSLNGEELNFSVRSDQVKAAKWYIDQLMTRFSEGKYDNLDLVGFYWLEEDTAKCGDLPKDVSEYIHKLDKRFYWIPYWHALGYRTWRKLGFDTAFLQPNYYFNKETPEDRLESACGTAKHFGMGLEMEFESSVLYEKEDSYYSRLEKYIDSFEKYGVFEQSSIAYYSGTKAILDMFRSDAIENTLILDRIANHILKRRARQVGIHIPWDTGNNLVAVGGTGELYVSGKAKLIEIYTTQGVLVGRGAGKLQCKSGIYIIKADGTTKKVVVR